ncbi:MAG: amino acid permease [Chitinophagales bacterium]|nr:amino acid permease [Chitinophagales bacterium]MDW8428404.1 amino acid permease [Chitinophagales bacterium]
MLKSLFIRKPIDKLLEQTEGGNQFKRSLGPVDLVMLGIGAIIGAGLFVRTAAAAAEHAGPAVVYSYILAGIGCAFAGLCYAEFASSIPVAGSAYTYSYATLGEFIAWIIGWELVLEYGLGAATVSIAWSEYLNKTLQSFFGVQVPYAWCHSPFERLYDASGNVVATGIVNLPAIGILLLLTVLLIRGTRQSAFVNSLIVIIKVSIVVAFILLGWKFMRPENHTPFVPPAGTYTDLDGYTHTFGGLLGILAGAGTVFFAFIGFDAVSTAAQEARNPRRDMPIGILVSLAICTVLYVLFSYVLTGIATLEDFRTTGKEASVAYAIQKYMTGFSWLADFISVAILAGFSSVILVMLLGQSRVFFSMSRDGLVPPIFSHIHPRYRTPYKSNIIFFIFTALFAGFMPGSLAGDLTSIGTLAAFVMVSAGVWVLRITQPNLPRAFRTPWVPFVPLMGVLVCGAMMLGLDQRTWNGFLLWTAAGLLIYFVYSRKHSVARKNNETA